MGVLDSVVDTASGSVLRFRCCFACSLSAELAVTAIFKSILQQFSAQQSSTSTAASATGTQDCTSRGLNGLANWESSGTVFCC